MTYRASGRKSASARRPVGHFTSKECAMNLGINAISLQPLLLSFMVTQEKLKPPTL